MDVETKNLWSSRLIGMFILGFCGFMHYSELSNLLGFNISVQGRHIKVFIEKEKLMYIKIRWKFGLLNLTLGLCRSTKNQTNAFLEHS